MKAKKTRSEQAEELLDMLPRKGDDAFQNFITALYNSSQRFLAEPLIRASGMDESSFLKGKVVFVCSPTKVWFASKKYG